ncbi:hypothetical protein NIES25_69860 (plasmid) [Nostoc linckia NIES-25]|nr:hypothetical protein NIES25_69860 [Nostoc linckia NIES-25]
MALVERESINFRLPKTLAKKLRFVARERKTTATDLVIQGLNHVLGDIQGTEESIENRLFKLEQEFFHFLQSMGEGANEGQQTRLANVEGKLEELSHKLARFEGILAQMQNTINASMSRKKSSSAYSYQNSTPVQLNPLNQEKLAMRLGTSASTIEEKRANLSQKDFESWTQERDFTNHAWRFNEKDGLYYPIK